MEESLEGSGITVDDILDGNLGAGLNPVPDGYTVGQGTAAVTFTNNLDGWDIHGVFIDPSDETEWSEERLGADYILAGDQTITVMVDPGTYDIQIIDEDGDTYSSGRSRSAPKVISGGYTGGHGLIHGVTSIGQCPRPSRRGFPSDQSPRTWILIFLFRGLLS